MAWGPRAASVATYLAAGQHLPYERLSVAMGVLFDAPIGQGTLATIMLRGEARLDEFIERLKGLLSQAPVVSADETSIRVATSSSWIHAISTPGLTFLALDEHRGIDAINNIGVLTRYSGVIMHDGLATYHRSELSGAGHAQCGAHLLRALGSVAGVRLHQPSAAALIGVLHDARRAATQAATAGLPASPSRSPRPSGPATTTPRTVGPTTSPPACAATPTRSFTSSTTPPSRYQQHRRAFLEDGEAPRQDQRHLHQHQPRPRVLRTAQLHQNRPSTSTEHPRYPLPATRHRRLATPTRLTAVWLHLLRSNWGIHPTLRHAGSSPDANEPLGNDRDTPLGRAVAARDAIGPTRDAVLVGREANAAPGLPHVGVIVVVPEVATDPFAIPKEESLPAHMCISCVSGSPRVPYPVSSSVNLPCGA